MKKRMNARERREIQKNNIDIKRKEKAELRNIENIKVSVGDYDLYSIYPRGWMNDDTIYVSATCGNRYDLTHNLLIRIKKAFGGDKVKAARYTYRRVKEAIKEYKKIHSYKGVIIMNPLDNKVCNFSKKYIISNNDKKFLLEFDITNNDEDKEYVYNNDVIICIKKSKDQINMFMKTNDIYDIYDINLIKEIARIHGITYSINKIFTDSSINDDKSIITINNDYSNITEQMMDICDKFCGDRDKSIRFIQLLSYAGLIDAHTNEYEKIKNNAVFSSYSVKIMFDKDKPMFFETNSINIKKSMMDRFNKLSISNGEYVRNPLLKTTNHVLKLDK